MTEESTNHVLISDDWIQFCEKHCHSKGLCSPKAPCIFIWPHVADTEQSAAIQHRMHCGVINAYKCQHQVHFYILK